jgi:hypothetical protein
MEKKFKPWMANVLVTVLELLILVIYFLIGRDAIMTIFEGNIAGGFEEVATAIWFLNIAVSVLAILCFTVKPLRTKTTIGWAILDLIWIAGNIYYLYA